MNRITNGLRLQLQSPLHRVEIAANPPEHDQLAPSLDQRVEDRLFRADDAVGLLDRQPRDGVVA